MDIAIPAAVVLGVSGLCYYYLSSPTAVSSGVLDGRKASTKAGIQESVNKPGGLQFSYTAWLRIDDFAYRYGQQKVIFVKGSSDLTVACPALLIDANTNTLLVKMDTFGAQETISITSVPSKKWLHIAITVDQEALTVYINGIIYARETLTQLPRQNSSSLLISPNGGFAGKIVSIEYTPTLLTTSDVLKLAAESPPISSEKGTQVVPPYFAPRWFKGE
jgi:hypothetical protein